MIQSNRFYLLLIVVFAFFIWIRDLSWVSFLGDVLPILSAFPLFYWLGKPWNLQKNEATFPSNQVITPCITLLLFGIAANLTAFLALSWVVLFWGWLSPQLEKNRKDVIFKLLPLLFLGFPWIALDATTIGWWFRFSGAAVTAFLFDSMGYEVIHMGTALNISGLTLSVEAACAGMNTLQSLLIAGTIAAHVLLGKSSRYWWAFPLLFVVAWVSNTIRIIVLTTVALFVSPTFALGAFHTWGGWMIIILMFVLTCGCLLLIEPKPLKTPPVQK